MLRVYIKREIVEDPTATTDQKRKCNAVAKKVTPTSKFRFNPANPLLVCGRRFRSNSVSELGMRPGGIPEVEHVNGREAQEGSEHSTEEGSNEGDERSDEVNSNEEENYASLPPTPQSSEDDEDEVMEDASGRSNANRDHAAYHLPTNLEIREGVNYQCPVQDWTVEVRYKDDTERETCVWRPTELIDDTAVNDYLSIALGCFNIEQDRAMYILQLSNYDVEEAKRKLAKRKVKKASWSEEDAIVFKQALQTCGKYFHRIKQLLPHKSVKELINFYYDNKKKLDFRSNVDTYLENNPQAKLQDSQLVLEDDDMELAEKKQGNGCYNCDKRTNLRQLDDLKFCEACFTHYRNYHRHRPCIRPRGRGANVNESIICPQGVVEIVERFLEFAREEDGAEQSASNSEVGLKVNIDDEPQIVKFIQLPEKCYVRILKDSEREEMLARGSCVRMEHSLRVQHNKLLSENLERYRISQPSTFFACARPRHCATWSYKEKWQALFAFQRYGKDFDAVAEVLENKTPNMVKAFYDEMREQIDDMISKSDDYYRNLAEKHDFESTVKVNESEQEVIDID